MTLWTITFWTLLGLVGFVLFLALQMRFLIMSTLKRVVVEYLKLDESNPQDRQTLERWVQANRNNTPGADKKTKDAIEHMNTHYPRPLSHLKLARRTSLVGPLLILALMITRELVDGGVL